MNRKITSATIVEYSIKDEVLNTVLGSVNSMMKIRISEKIPLIRILLKNFHSFPSEAGIEELLSILKVDFLIFRLLFILDNTLILCKKSILMPPEAIILAHFGTYLVAIMKQSQTILRWCINITQNTNFEGIQINCYQLGEL